MKINFAIQESLQNISREKRNERKLVTECLTKSFFIFAPFALFAASQLLAFVSKS